MHNLIKFATIALFVIVAIFIYIFSKYSSLKDSSATTTIISDSISNKEIIADSKDVTANVLSQDKEHIIADSKDVTALDVNKEKIGEIIKEYLLNNPEIILEAVDNLQKNKLKENSLKSKQYIEKNIDILTNSTASIILGNKESDKIIIYFFDYSCSYCRKAGQYIADFIERNKDVKFILRPTPILGETSDYLARLIFSISKIAPNKVVEIHNALLSMNQITKDSLAELLNKNNLDASLIMDEMESYNIKSLIKYNMDIATNVKIQSVPTYIINQEIISGVLDVIQLEKYLVK